MMQNSVHDNAQDNVQDSDQRFTHNLAFSVLGLALRTSNAEGFETIPAHWQRFFGEGVPARLSSRLDDDLYAVYTDFEHSGRSNEGLYTLVIGARVAADCAVPHGLTRVHVPASRRCVFDVPAGAPQQVGEVWREIWARSDLRKTFISDYEHYRASGEIRILVGVEPS
jgi:predicted transcriptional regulator YdeE